MFNIYQHIIYLLITLIIFALIYMFNKELRDQLEWDAPLYCGAIAFLILEAIVWFFYIINYLLLFYA